MDTQHHLPNNPIFLHVQSKIREKKKELSLTGFGKEIERMKKRRVG